MFWNSKLQAKPKQIPSGLRWLLVVAIVAPAAAVANGSLIQALNNGQLQPIASSPIANSRDLVSINNERENANQLQLQPQPQMQQVSLYRQPNSWLASLLRDFFNDIDWQTIEEAREQVEKFIRKVDQLIGSIRSVLAKAASGSSATSSSFGDRDGGPSSSTSRWWSSYWSTTTKASQTDDASSVKGMLERVACFVGYLRLMNLSNEALAELDASRVVSGLFGAGQRRNSTGMWSWFG